MNRYQAILIDETGCEFGVTIDAYNRAQVWEELAEDYPECRVTQVLSQAEIEERQREIYYEDPYDDDYGY